ncbi:hypothetical protein FQN50_006025 [Emmonsiellopsis sp. PD_5]|nr:hypothetical protein FQN50_006025 [Emmonsiellopsis sp. PD_5]
MSQGNPGSHKSEKMGDMSLGKEVRHKKSMKRAATRNSSKSQDAEDMIGPSEDQWGDVRRGLLPGVKAEVSCRRATNSREQACQRARKQRARRYRAGTDEIDAWLDNTGGLVRSRQGVGVRWAVERELSVGILCTASSEVSLSAVAARLTMQSRKRQPPAATAVQHHQGFTRWPLPKNKKQLILRQRAQYYGNINTRFHASREPLSSIKRAFPPLCHESISQCPRLEADVKGNSYYSVPEMSKERYVPLQCCYYPVKLLANRPARHYSYECKASAQERPYTSRPSRSQQLANPKLAPKLMSDVPNDLLRTYVLPLPARLGLLINMLFCSKGVADEQLALRESERGRKREAADERDDEPIRSHSRKRARSASPAYSSSSVSTISTNRSWSRSPRRKRDISRSPYRSRERKRKMSDSLSEHSNITASSAERRGAPSRAPDRNTRRRRKSRSPSARGRHRDSDRRGSWRNRSRSESMDRSSIAKQRRSLTPGSPNRGQYSGRGRPGRARSPEPRQGTRGSPARGRPHEPTHNGARERPQSPPPRKERSLSPFSKRLALTQAMNMNR